MNGTPETVEPVANEAPRPQRLFFALWPDAGLQERLHALAREAVPERRARCLPVHNIHLTLAFLGYVSAAQRSCLERAAAEVRAAPFTLVLDQLGCFRRAGILWAGATVVPQALRTLIQGLNAGMAGCGLTPDKREFRLHVTLARKLRRCLPARPIAPPLPWSVERFSLVLSNTYPDGARYEILRTWELL
jgi:2'-5' RNA ligase